jgi:hypothetical protein
MIICVVIAAAKKYVVDKIETIAARLPRVAAGEFIMCLLIVRMISVEPDEEFLRCE